MFYKTGIGFVKKDLEIYFPTATLIYGPPGSFKTIFGLQAVHNGYKKYNQNGAYFQIVYNPFEIDIYAKNYNWNFPKLQEENKIIISSFNMSDYLLFEPTKYKTEIIIKILSIVKDLEIKRVVFDQMEYIRKYLDNDAKYLQILTYTINVLKECGCSIFIVQQTAGIEKMLFENVFKLENEKLIIEKSVGTIFDKKEYRIKITNDGLDIE